MILLATLKLVASQWSQRSIPSAERKFYSLGPNGPAELVYYRKLLSLTLALLSIRCGLDLLQTIVQPH